MKLFADVKATPEQLKLFVPDPKTMIIKGAAGSGKTTTCLLRLRMVIARLASLRKRSGNTTPLRVLVLTYNRTLCGYISQLAESQEKYFEGADIQISTFGGLAFDLLGINPNQICESKKSSYLEKGFSEFPQSASFLASELEYVLGRFPHDQLGAYLDNERTGRGHSPRFDGKRKSQFLEKVILPYMVTKKKANEFDFSDLAFEVSKLPSPPKYDVVVIDEGQDFSTNEFRAVRNILADDYNLTIVIDSAQKIYSKSSDLREAGFTFGQENVFQLTENFRNTREIADFIAPIINGADLGGDFGAIPSPESCQRRGEKPVLIEGIYSKQIKWVFSTLIPRIDTENETVAFLHPKGWFRYVIHALNRHNIKYVSLTKQIEWPDDDINVGLITMHSAKGLEFDHVIILGLNQETTPHGTEPGDVLLDQYRRLFAMSCGRARNTLTVGYKHEDKSTLINYLDPSTYSQVEV